MGSFTCASVYLMFNLQHMYYIFKSVISLDMGKTRGVGSVTDPFLKLFLNLGSKEVTFHEVEQLALGRAVKSGERFTNAFRSGGWSCRLTFFVPLFSL